MSLSLLLEANQTRFGFTDTGVWRESQGQSTGDSTLLLDFPAILALTISLEGQRPHEIHASLDRGAVERLDPSSMVEFSLRLAGGDQFELA